MTSLQSNILIKKNSYFTLLEFDSINIFRLIFYIVSLLVLIRLYFQLDYESFLLEKYMSQSVLYFLIGIAAATIANSTGAGGGIVFLPIFIGLGFSPLESLSTSIAIQCFGMTSGALTWIKYRKKELDKYNKQWNLFFYIILISAISSCTGVIFTQYFLSESLIQVEMLFAIFSFIIGSIILLRTIKLKKEHVGRTSSLTNIEIVGLVIVCLIGGAITSWLSIGVGEILLIYLMFLGFRLNMVVAIAVCISSISVLVALPYHVLSETISLNVLVFAAPGALIGGVIARSLATYLGAHKLKIATSIWIILSSIPYLVISL
jgi:uncharacterized protein